MSVRSAETVMMSGDETAHQPDACMWSEECKQGWYTVREIGEQDNPNYLPTYEGCYVCGQSHPRGLRIRFFTGSFGQVCACFKPDCTQTGYKDVVHGGVISTLLDELLGWPIALQTGRMAVTGELTVRFRKPMSCNHAYLATAYPGKDRGRYWEGKGDIRDDQGNIYATAQGKYFLLSAEQTAQVAEELTYQTGDPPVFRYNSQKGGLPRKALKLPVP